MSLDDALLRLWVLAVDVLRYGLVNRYRQYELMIKRACLYLVDEPLLLCEEAAVEVRWLDVVDGKGNLLVLAVLQEVVVLKVCLLLCLDDPSHKLHGGIVLPAVFSSLRLHHHLAELLCVRL